MPRDRGTAERFLTTVVMTDIVGSTEHAAELGDSAWRELLQQHNALIRAELRGHGGREMDTAGDGFFVIFDAPATAVACVLAIADEVRILGLEIRAGVHVGEVQQMAGKVTGIAVVIASRIMAAGGGGEVLVSATVRDLTAGSGLTFDDRGVRQLKGVPGEWRIYAVSRVEVAGVEAGLPTEALERRAAAVRRAQARPIWRTSPDLFAPIKDRYPGQWKVGSVGTIYVNMNTALPRSIASRPGRRSTTPSTGPRWPTSPADRRTRPSPASSCRPGGPGTSRTARTPGALTRAAAGAHPTSPRRSGSSTPAAREERRWWWARHSQSCRASSTTLRRS